MNTGTVLLSVHLQLFVLYSFCAMKLMHRHKVLIPLHFRGTTTFLLLFHFITWQLWSHSWTQSQPSPNPVPGLGWDSVLLEFAEKSRDKWSDLEKILIFCHVSAMEPLRSVHVVRSSLRYWKAARKLIFGKKNHVFEAKFSILGFGYPTSRGLIFLSF